MNKHIKILISFLFLLMISVQAFAYNTVTGKNTLDWGTSTDTMVAIDGNKLEPNDAFLLLDATGEVQASFHIEESGETANGTTIFAPTSNAGDKRWHKNGGDFTEIKINGVTLNASHVGAIAITAIDSDLDEVSSSDDTVPSAKETKARLDLKANLASPQFTTLIRVLHTEPSIFLDDSDAPGTDKGGIKWYGQYASGDEGSEDFAFFMAAKIDGTYTDIFGWAAGLSKLMIYKDTTIDGTLTVNDGIVVPQGATETSTTYYEASGNGTSKVTLKSAASLDADYYVTLPSSTGTLATLTSSAASMTVDASGFNGNLATTDDTIQEIAQKVDDMTAGGASLSGLTDNRLIRAHGTDNVQNSAYSEDDTGLITPPPVAVAYSWYYSSGTYSGRIMFTGSTGLYEFMTGTSSTNPTTLSTVGMSLSRTGDLDVANNLTGYVPALSNDTSIAAGEAKGQVDYITASGTASLPSAVVGMHITFVITGAYTLQIDPYSTEQLNLEGSLLTGGYRINNTSGMAGDRVVLHCYETGKWWVFVGRGTWASSGS
jgi:hypothetical protein